MEFSGQEDWNGLPHPPPGDLPDPGIESGPPALQAGSLPSELQRSPIKHISQKKKKTYVIYNMTSSFRFYNQSYENNIQEPVTICRVSALEKTW